MVEDDAPKAQAPKSPDASKFPDRTFPVVFADAVSATGRAAGLVKFYFVRTDPSMIADLTSNTLPFLQMVMPIMGFAAMTTFFESQLNEMVEKCEVPKTTIEEWREHYRKSQAVARDTNSE